MSNNLAHLAAVKRSIPVDVHGLARRLGIYVSKSYLPDNQSGFIRKEISGNYSIGINREDGDLRQRFTLAHELGHFYLHSDLLEAGGSHFDRLYSGHNDSGKLSPYDEAQANKFAAELLMPSNQVKRMWSPNGLTYKQLARKFEVSPKAMAWRLVNLRLASKQEVDL